MELQLFALAIAKTLLRTGLGPAILLAVAAEKFGRLIPFHKFEAGAVRPRQSESGHISGSTPEFVSDSSSASFKNSGGRQLAPSTVLIPVNQDRATRLPRKVRRSA
jgi:hypothetical protein